MLVQAKFHEFRPWWLPEKAAMILPKVRKNGKSNCCIPVLPWIVKMFPLWTESRS